MKKTIQLKTLRLENFKGIRSLTINFSPVTNIHGYNATGKSTLADGWNWLLFGKDSHGNSDTKFGIKTTDKNNNVIPKLEHFAEAAILIDGVEHTLKRVLREKWVKKRGAIEAEFTGNTTEYYWDDVPKSASEYNAKISEIVDEGVFKLLTDPQAFNAQHWEKQRNTLMDISGETSGIDDIEDKKKMLAAKRRKLNEAIKDIPSRIDEVYRSMPEERDWDALQKEKDETDKQLAVIGSQIDDRNKKADQEAASLKKISNELFALKSKKQDIELAAKKQVDGMGAKANAEGSKMRLEVESVRGDRWQYGKNIEKMEADLSDSKNELERTKTDLEDKRKDWGRHNGTEIKFDDSMFNCPTCKRPLEAEDIEAEKEKMRADFNSKKRRTLDRINEEGSELSEKQKRLELDVKALEERIKIEKEKLSEAEKKLEKLQKEYDEWLATPQQGIDEEAETAKILHGDKEYRSLQKKVAELEAAARNRPEINVADLKEQRRSLQENMEKLNYYQNDRVLREQAQNRISELEAEEKNYAQQIADIEKEEFAVQNELESIVNVIEAKVNAMFPVTRFKLFDTQINGAVVLTCKATYKGVDWADVNTAGKVHCGIEIINVLSEHYGVSATIWVDNAESVVDTPKTDAQLIRLVVDENYKKLTVL